MCSSSVTGSQPYPWWESKPPLAPTPGMFGQEANVKVQGVLVGFALFLLFALPFLFLSPCLTVGLDKIISNQLHLPSYLHLSLIHLIAGCSILARPEQAIPASLSVQSTTLLFFTTSLPHFPWYPQAPTC